MSKYSWMGVHRNHITCGKGKGFTKNTLQGAVDLAKTLSLAPENPGLISVDRGYYLEAVQIADVTDLSIIGLPGSIIARDNTIQTDPGGTLNIGNALFDTTERIRIEGLHVVNKRSGDATTPEGGPPEGAIFVGEEETYNISGNGWDSVIIRNCIIDGVHDALQMFGHNRNGGSNATPPSQIWLINNVIRCAHDAVTTKGRLRGYSSCNQIYSDSNGISPYLTNVADWKTTGYHHNTARGQGDDEGLGFWISDSDIFHVIGGSNLSTSDNLAGVFVYAGGKLGVTPMPHVFLSPKIRVESDNAITGADPPCGILIRDQALCPHDDWLVVQGGSIHVHQQNASGNPTAAGVRVNVSQTSGNNGVLKIIGTRIYVVNDETGSGNAYSLQTNGAFSEILHRVYSPQGTDAGTGTITQLSPVA